MYHIASNFLHRYAALVAYSNYLLEASEHDKYLNWIDFPTWLSTHKDVSKIIKRNNLD